MSVKIKGTFRDTFRAIILKSIDNILEIRNADDSDYATIRAADPVGEDDLVTSRHLEARLDGAGDSRNSYFPSGW
jgi:hypothetical protein